MKKSFKENIIQLFLIIFSVVLGLYLSERIEERKNEKEARLLLSKIAAEVNKNKELLEDWIPYHRAIYRRLDSLNNDEIFIKNFVDDESVLFERVITRGNLMGEMPSAEAWDIAKSHPLIVHFDYDDLLLFTRIYNQQAMTYEPVPKLIELFLSADFNSAAHAESNLQTFKNQIREVVTREIQLLQYIKERDKNLEL
ncbi:MAG: hypothetical protein AAF573_14945 [Bacteroidota bacterium]